MEVNCAFFCTEKMSEVFFVPYEAPKYPLHPPLPLSMSEREVFLPSSADLVPKKSHGTAAATLIKVWAAAGHGCQMAIARFLDRLCLALQASGLWLSYATLQNLIPSFPWIAQC